ncbi:sensor histidine kinase [Halorhabdus sp. CUG00001]|uniref:sensor histidine kinase n=1 Tax=Halorhabdus sp. CUG00001 TaxID=2600297 RepID=UPI00131C19D5|nr:sensor histidine kinase [Halorhabdus sp. CUG00001]
MRLRTTLLGVLLLVAVVLSGTIYAGFTMHKNGVVDQEREDVKRTAAVVANRIDARLTTTVEAVDLWGASIAVTSDGPVGQFSALNTFTNRTAFDRAGLYTADGVLTLVAGSGLTPEDFETLVGHNYTDEPFVQEALAGDVYVGQPTQSVTGQHVFRIAAPIRTQRGSVAGVFSGTFEIGDGSLLGDIASVGHDDDRIRITANGTTLLADSSADGKTLEATATVGQTGWTVAVERPRSTIAGRLTLATAMQFGGVFIALLAVSIVGVWISRTTLTRIRDLLEAAADLESGAYRTALDLGNIEEWRQLSERFNSLAETLEQRDSQLRVLNRVLRHNLRNDMNVITARAERALADDDTPASVKQDVEQIHETATRLINTSEHARTLYDDLLATPTQTIEPVDVTTIVEQRTERLAAEYPESTIETTLPECAWALDSTAVPIVVEEIVRNAIVHNDLPEAERTVTVTVEPEHDSTECIETEHETRIVVADNGPGLPMVEEALLTNQFEETPIEHGSGLGVWLANWLIDQLGGAVSVSTGIDRGTTVTIHLPAPATPPTDE